MKWIFEKLGYRPARDFELLSGMLSPSLANEVRNDLINLKTKHSNDSHVKISAVNKLIKKYTPKALKG